MKHTPARLFLLAFLSLAGFAPARAADTPFTPAVGFEGSSTGKGVMQLALRRPQTFHVESHGQTEPDGFFRLDQAVTFAGEPTEHRTWFIRTDAAGNSVGTLTDAAGPVTGQTQGRVLAFAYRLKGLLYMHQTLVLSRDGRSIDNLSQITLLGLPVGHLHETITRAAPAATVPDSVPSPGAD